MTEPQTDPGEELDPTIKPKSAKMWLDVIRHTTKEFRGYQERCDKVERLYANLEKLANNERDREFQLFWANIQVLAPSIYSRPPVPVVVPRFQDRRPLARTASELLERCTSVGFELEDIDYTMRQVRDDVAIIARGVIWLRYETKEENGGLVEKVCIEHVDRKEFLHDPARKWSEVDWVARGSWLTKSQARKRFSKTSGKAYQDLAYEQRKDNAHDDEPDDGKAKALIWEIWCKSANIVVWVSEGSEALLDSGKPHLDLSGFFPCPRPAYGTVQRRTLLPVPDFVFYRDQLEEINELTARIHSLSESVKLRGFYPSGSGELGDAIEAAVKSQEDNAVLIPVANWALLGSGTPKDMIVWLPLDMVANVITQLVALRKQLISDVYEITGLSDIMRGATAPSETATAQQLKSQYGSVRVRDRTEELVRIARDTARIAAEIMAENFQSKTMLDMSQMEIPSDADIAKQVKPLDQQAKQIAAQVEKAKADPNLQAQAKQQPEQAQQMLQQAQQQVGEITKRINDLQAQPTIETVVKFLRDQRLRPFVLDIETDSTIAPDENAQKQRATEYLTAMGGLLAQAIPAIQGMPQIAPLVAGTIQFAQSQFRVGRSMDQTVEEFTDAMKAMAQQPRPNVEADRMQAEQKAQEAKAQMESQVQQARLQLEAQGQQADIAAKAQDGQIRLAELQLKQQDAQAKAQTDAVLAQATLAIKDIEKQIKEAELLLKQGELVAMGMEQSPDGNGVISSVQKSHDVLITALAGLNDMIAQASAQQQAQNEAIMGGLSGLAQLHSAPKRIVRDPAGRAIGVETVPAPTQETM